MEREETPAAVEETAREDKLAELDILKQSLEEKDKQARQNWDQYLRAKAELENFRKRSEKNAAEAALYGEACVMEKILAVWDQLSAGLLQLKADGRADAKVKQGFDLVAKNFEELFKSCGVARIQAPAGTVYDPHMHEVVRLEESEGPEGVILKAEGEGFLMAGRVLRPARVVASKKK